MAFEEHGNLAVELGADPPAVLVEGIRAFKSAYAATHEEEMRLAALERRTT